MKSQCDELAEVIYASHRGNTQVDLLDNRRLQGSQLAWARLAAATLVASGWRKAPRASAPSAVEALAKRNYEAEWSKGWEACPEDARLGWMEAAQATIDFLSGAGFGPVAEVRAQALEDAAQQMRDERHSWCLDDAGRYWIKRTLDELAERAVAERGQA